MLELTDRGIADVKAWEAKGYALPRFDREAMRAETRRAPQWVHFGAGNIFKALQANAAQKLLDAGELKTGIIAVERSASDEKRASYDCHDDLTVYVMLKSDGSVEKTVIGSIAEVCWLLGEDAGSAKRLREAFSSPSLQMASFTITEKGYRTAGSEADLDAAPEDAKSYWGRVTALLLERYRACGAPLAMVSMDNCSRNGETLRASVMAFANAWVERGAAEKGFIEYLNDKVSFPWTMIDKITPAPDASVEAMLRADGLELSSAITGEGTHIAPFVNAEESEYLVVEDSFPNGRPPLEHAGVIFTSRETVQSAERMKVCSCLNPLHTALAVSGCLLGCTRISEEMKDPELSALARGVGYAEGLAAAADPGVIDPREFLDTVVNVRLTNPFLPDTPQRIATDTSQKMPIRFGETIKSYAQSPDRDVRQLKFIPLTIALWLRYLLGVDDRGEPFACSGDPLLSELRGKLSGVEPGRPDSADDAVLAPILSDRTLFAADLCELGLAEKIGGMLRELLEGPGAVRRTLKKYTA